MRQKPNLNLPILRLAPSFGTYGYYSMYGKKFRSTIYGTTTYVRTVISG